MRAPHRRFTDEEKATVVNYPAAVACKMIDRTYAVCRAQRYKLRQRRAERDHLPFSEKEDKLMRKHYEISTSAEMLALLPGRSVMRIISRARVLKLRKVFLGTSKEIGLLDHMELYDQIMIRARRDKISMQALDKHCGTGTHFRKWTSRKHPNLIAIVKALDFFGGKLVIDWQDR